MVTGVIVAVVYILVKDTAKTHYRLDLLNPPNFLYTLPHNIEREYSIVKNKRPQRSSLAQECELVTPIEHRSCRLCIIGRLLILIPC